MKNRQQRSKPMAAADRRHAILAAVIPLLLEKGAAVTTAEMARAAGIAEGTIFRAFPDKASLMHAAVERTMDPAPVVDAVRAISASTSMKTQLTAAARVLLDHFGRVVAIAELLHTMPEPPGARRSKGRHLITASSAAISAGLKELFERHRDQLSVPPAKAVAAFRSLIFASGHPLVPPEERLTVGEVVAILLSGVLKRQAK